jgi:branched-chain amino acid transport system ATP-binding protein
LPPETPTGPVLRLEGVVRRYGGLVAVDRVSLSLGPRQRLAIIGPNGAGKTTLFRLIAGDVAPTEGRVHLFGRDVTRMPAHRRARLGLSRTFQVTNLSHGEQRQLEVAMALATEPRVLLLDEPAAGLSAGERARFRGLLEALPRSLPLLLIEHDMRLALSLADEVLCLHNGRQIALGPPSEVRDDETVQAVYLGRAVDA